MFEQEITKNYTGGDALGEILIMLIIAFILGWISRMIWDKVYKEFFLIDEKYVAKKEKIVNREVKPASVAQKVVKQAPVAPVAEVLKTEKVEVKVSNNGLKNDDLKIVEGIGPKIEILLKNAKINTWEDLASTDINRIKMVLKEGGDRFAFHDPSTWPEQAMLASKGSWDELQEFQEFLSGGRHLEG